MRQKVNAVVDSATPAFRVVILGGRNVGKSALVVRFLTKRFIGEYVSGTEITYLQEVALAGNTVTTEICDAMINKEPHEYLKKLAANTDAYFVVYSVCSRASFEYACDLVQVVKKNHDNLNRVKPLLLLGNKSDLDHLREVKHHEGEDFAKTLPSCHFMETSAAESYVEVEKAFQLVFELVQKRFQPLPTPSVPPHRPVRKNSISQMAHMIREHVRKQHSNSTTRKSNSLERGMSLSRSNSVTYDSNNNSTLHDLSWKRRTRKHGIGVLQSGNSPFINNQKPKLLSKCVSLSTLTERPANESLVHRENTSYEETTPRQSRHHVIDGNMSHSFSDMRKNRDTSSWPSGVTVKMSLSSDEAIELSDMSTPEEDTFIPYSANMSLAKSNTDPQIAEQGHNEAERPTTLTNPGSPHRSRKISEKKKTLQIAVHSDGELEDKDCEELHELPPKSAPISHSTSGNKFRFFPNVGISENQDTLKQPWTALSNTTVPLSPLLNHGKRQARIKSPKEEKRCPSHNLLKQFFKGALHGSSSSKGISGSSLSLPAQVSPAASENNLILPEHSRKILTSIDEQQSSENGDTSQENGAIYFHASSVSLSSINSNEGSVFDSFNSTSSAPCSPQVKKANNPPVIKTRRASFRETVGDFVRIRKKSNASDCFKHSKERFL